MQRISAFSVNLSINLEPVYGILFALFIFKDSEHMSGGFYLGAAIILFSVFSHAVIEGYLSRRQKIIAARAIPENVPGNLFP
jgi:drug/metabolite transporter (DMT)-like permease